MSIRSILRHTLFVVFLCALGARVSHAQIFTNNGASIKTTAGAIVQINGSANNASGTYDNTGSTTVTGSYTNVGTTIDAGSLYVGGDWINNGTFTRSTGSVYMNGAAQNFAGSQITTFNNLLIQGGSNKTFNQSERVDGLLTFTSGVLVTTETNLLTFTTNGTWTGAASASYVSGPAAKDFNSTTEFQLPIGKLGRVNTAGVKPSSATATTFRAEYFFSPYVNITSVIAPLQVVSSFQYWNIDRTSGSSNAQVRLYWISGDYNLPSYISNINTLEVARWTGTAWTGEGRAFVTGTYVSGNILSNVVTTWGLLPNEHFTIGSDSTENSLPVELDHFAAKQVGSQVKLEWLTRSEIQNLGFEIERRPAGEAGSVIQTWQTDSALRAKSRFGADYLSFDAPPTDGAWTYDLFQRDLNGARWHIASQTLLYSRVPDAEPLTVEIYPNPAVADAQLRIGIQSNVESIQVELFDNTGRKVFEDQVGPMAAGFHSYALTGLSKFASGRYMIVLHAGSTTSTKSLIITK